MRWRTPAGIVLLAAAVAAAASAPAPPAPPPAPAPHLADAVVDAVRREDHARLRELAASGANLDAPGFTTDITPLGIAARRGDRATATVLLDLGANPRARSRDGAAATPLHWAITDTLASIRMVELLLERGANPDEADADGMTPLMAAADWNNSEVIKRLAKAGASVDATSRYLRGAFRPLEPRYVATSLSEPPVDLAGRAPGITALMIAAERGHADSVEALLAAGASVAKASRTGRTALWFATQSVAAPCVRALTAAGASVDRAPARGESPLAAAARVVDEVRTRRHRLSSGRGVDADQLLRDAGEILDHLELYRAELPPPPPPLPPNRT